MWAPQAPRVSSGLEWHGNLELDGGYVKYSWAGAFVPESVYDSRGRFVLGPMLTQTLGNDYFLRVTGQVVAWVREIYGIYQINADDVYVQVGKQGLWDFMAGRFLTWRVFRKGLGFDLYTLEDTGALASTCTRSTLSSCGTQKHQGCPQAGPRFTCIQIRGRGSNWLDPTVG
jgi:hypothetical protein